MRAVLKACRFFICLLMVPNTVCFLPVENENQQAIQSGRGMLCLKGQANLSLVSSLHGIDRQLVLPHKAMVLSGPGLLPRAMFRSVAQQPSGSELMSVTLGCEGAQGKDRLLRLMLVSKGLANTRAMVMSRPRMLPRAMSGSVFL